MKPLLAVAAALLSLGAAALSAPKAIVIDPGHGGAADSGSMEARTLSAANNARTPGGIKEKDLTLELSREVRDAINQIAASRGAAVAVKITRDQDSNPDFGARSKICEGANAAVIVSIHFNASEGHRALGTTGVIQAKSRNPRYETDYKFASGLAKACSAAVHEFVPESHPREPITDGELHGGRGSNFFYQLSQIKSLSATPVCFLEVEFIDRSDVEELLVKQRKQAFPKIAHAIAEYLVDYVKAN